MAATNRSNNVGPSGPGEGAVLQAQPPSVVVPALPPLPSVTLASFVVAFIARMTRSTMIEVLSQDYTTTARSKGLKEEVVIIKHALKNALIPIITVVGLQFGLLLGGAVLTETVFAWPGIGRLIVDSILARDYPMIQGTILIFGLLYILVNLVVDLIYAWVDPRIHYD